MNLQQLNHRPRGPFNQPDWLIRRAGTREIAVLLSDDCCNFPHKLNKDCDFYISDDCITYSSPTIGSFTINATTREIVN